MIKKVLLIISALFAGTIAIGGYETQFYSEFQDFYYFLISSKEEQQFGRINALK